MKNKQRVSNNSNDTKKIRKILNEEIRMGYNANSDSETEEIDLRKELYPLSHYINNREEMIEQMFSIIKGTKLNRMIPAILKDVPLDELKADCLIHLLGMSRKRILAILEGKEINSSSDSETDSNKSVSLSKNVPVKPIVIKQEGCSDISDNSEEVVLVNPDLEDMMDVISAKNIFEDGENSKRRHCLKKRKLEKKKKIAKKKIIQENPKDSEIPSEESHETISDNDHEIEAPKEGKTLLEILELEMRARAIRALLNKDGSEREENKNSAENPSQDSLHSGAKDVSNKNKKAREKITPVKNFRRKKRKTDDLIIITPKVVTIDLTDETGPVNENSKIIEEEKRESLLDRVSCVQETSDKVVKGSPQVKLSVEGSSSLSEAKSGDITDKTEQSKSNWTQRWLESKEVKKVVSTSKICGNIRKRIKSAKLAKKSQVISPKLKTDSPEIQGSVCEYKSLPKSKNIQNLDAEIPNNNICDTSIVILSSLSIQSEEKCHKDQILTVEQVQDVTSTKSENTTEDNSQDKNDGYDNELINSSTVSNQVDEIDQIVSYSSTCNLKSKVEVKSEAESEMANVIEPDTNDKQHLTGMTCEIDLIDTNLVLDNVSHLKYEINELQPFSNEISEQNFNDTKPLLKQNILPLNTYIKEDIEISGLCDSKSHVSANVNVESMASTINNETTIQTNYVNTCSKIETYNAISDQSKNQNSTDSELSNNSIEETVSITCGSKTNACEAVTDIENPTQELLNEPETLEINITDEDRELGL